MNRPADAKGEVDWFGLETLVPFRIGAGDDVDCFNLTASTQPRLLGVDPDLLEGRFALEVQSHAAAVVVTQPVLASTLDVAGSSRTK